MSRRLVFATLAVLALAAAAYCFMGYAMTASLYLTNATGRDDGRASLLWAIGIVVSLLAAVALAVLAWRQGSRPQI